MATDSSRRDSNYQSTFLRKTRSTGDFRVLTTFVDHDKLVSKGQQDQTSEKITTDFKKERNDKHTMTNSNHIEKLIGRV